MKRKTQAKHNTPIEFEKRFAYPDLETLIKFSCIYLQKHYHKFKIASVLLNARDCRGTQQNCRTINKRDVWLNHKMLTFSQTRDQQTHHT